MGGREREGKGREMMTKEREMWKRGGSILRGQTKENLRKKKNGEEKSPTRNYIYFF